MSSISTLESRASRIRLAALQHAIDEKERAERGLQQEFLAAVQRGDVKAWARFAPLTKDWTAHHNGNHTAKRAQTLGEVMADSLEYGTGPSASDVMSMLCAVAYGSEPQVAQARALIDGMARAWASQNAEVGE